VQKLEHRGDATVISNLSAHMQITYYLDELKTWAEGAAASTGDAAGPSAGDTDTADTEKADRAKLDSRARTVYAAIESSIPESAVLADLSVSVTLATNRGRIDIMIRLPALAGHASFKSPGVAVDLYRSKKSDTPGGIDAHLAQTPQVKAQQAREFMKQRAAEKKVASSGDGGEDRSPGSPGSPGSRRGKGTPRKDQGKSKRPRIDTRTPAEIEQAAARSLEKQAKQAKKDAKLTWAVWTQGNMDAHTLVQRFANLDVHGVADDASPQAPPPPPPPPGRVLAVNSLIDLSRDANVDDGEVMSPPARG
jgi:hypothetical protein